MLITLQKNIGYTFKNVKILEQALTHSSWTNEQDKTAQHNERLEFLGDAVLEICISEKLYSFFPDEREGVLTHMRSQLVSKQALAVLAFDLQLEHYLRLGKGEESQGGRTRDTLLSDAFEAMLGAVFLDGGFPSAQIVIANLFAEQWVHLKETKSNKDYKSLLQEITQHHFQMRPLYTLNNTQGPEHLKEFEVLLKLPDKHEIIAVGSSVKRAEQKAAQMALEYMQQQNPEITF